VRRETSLENLLKSFCPQGSVNCIGHYAGFLQVLVDLTPEYRRETIRVFTKRTLLALIES
jgi:hypothetical protein